MTSEAGTIASPGYPNNYPLLVECVWTLRASPGLKRNTLITYPFGYQCQT